MLWDEPRLYDSAYSLVRLGSSADPTDFLYLRAPYDLWFPSSMKPPCILGSL